MLHVAKIFSNRLRKTILKEPSEYHENNEQRLQIFQYQSIFIRHKLIWAILTYRTVQFKSL